MQERNKCPLLFTGAATRNCYEEKCGWFLKKDESKAKGSCAIKIIAEKLTEIRLR